MSAALQKLDFMVSLIDRVSGPAGKVMKTMDKVTTNIQGGMRKVGYGAAGLAGAAFAIERLIAPAKEMRTALGTIESLGVEQPGLNSLRKTAFQASNEFGKSAVDIINSSYRLQSAISGLETGELDELTYKSTLLATATKGSLDSTNAYVGQMFNIHAAEADAIGKTAFMDKLIGKTAKAVQLFNTDGTQMGEAMKNIGKQATAMKVPLEEQLAVMGFLQNTMIEGSRSGTAYAGFLSNISKAEGVLGMKFTDTAGAALPIVEIIEKLQGKYGDLSKAGDQMQFQKAFTKSGAKLISAMAGSLDTFSGNLKSINAVKGLDGVYKMAKAITDPWDQAGQTMTNVQTMFGEKLLKVLTPAYQWIAKMGVETLAWMDKYPILSQYLGYVVVGIVGFIAAISALSIVVGIGQLMMAGWGIAVLSFNFVLGLTKGIIFGVKIMAALAGGVFNALSWAFKSTTIGVWLFNSALLANPMVWIVVGIVALGAALMALVVYWDDVTESVGRFFTAISDFFDMGGVLNEISSLFGFDGSISTQVMGPPLPETPKAVPSPFSLNSSQPPAKIGGGVMKQITNATNSNNNSRTMGDVTIINNGQPIGQQIEEEFELRAG